jgi:hypothetical protein
MMRMLDTQRPRHLQLASLNWVCAMAIRYAFYSEYHENCYIHATINMITNM